jgi:signal transduction histidine kinase/DNA-binding response OmpR family regulator/predicted RNA-binding protein with RPS1 domain
MKRYRLGEIVKGRVKRALPYRTFVEIDNGEVERDVGTIPVEEYFWSDEENKNYEEVFKKGKEIELTVLYYSRDSESLNLVLSRRFALFKDGKQRDPWVEIEKKYRVDDIVGVTVTQVAGNRAFGHIEEGIKAIINLETLRTFLNEEYKKKFKEETDNEHFKPNDVLYSGDKIRGIIENIDNKKRLVKLNVKEYLKSIGRRIVRSLRAPQKIEPKIIEEYPADRKMKDFNIKKIFFADDDETLGNLVKKELAQAGIEVITFHKIGDIESFLKEESVGDVDLFMVDLCFEGDMKAGLKVCKNIRNTSPDGMIILCTAYNIFEQYNEIDKLNIYDVLLKPFKVTAFEDFLRNIDNGRRFLRLPKSVENQAEKDLHTELEKEFSSRLKKLVRETGAIAGAIFSYNPLNERVELKAWENDILYKKFNILQKYMHKSPIRDILMRGERFDDNRSPFRSEGKFRYFLKLIEFNRVIGLPIEVPHDLGFCFFIFFKDKIEINDIDNEKARCAAADFQNIFMEVIYEEWALERQNFYLEGKLLSEYGHELETKTTDLSFLSKFLKDNLKNVNDIKARSEIQKAIIDLNDLSDEIIELGEKLAGLSKKQDENALRLEDILNRIIDFAKFTATKKKIIIHTRFSNDIPLIKIGRTDLQQVFLNVILNAIQQIDWFIRDEGQIEVNAEHDLEEKLPIKIRIKDTGIGIHKKDFERIFKPLYTTRKGGHGMGLAISKRIMESINGEIVVDESYMYEGTTFLISLPRSLIATR